MNDVKLNGMRELNFNEVEEVSGAWLGFSWRVISQTLGFGAVTQVIGKDVYTDYAIRQADRYENYGGW